MALGTAGSPDGSVELLSLHSWLSTQLAAAYPGDLDPSGVRERCCDVVAIQMRFIERAMS